MRVADRPAAEVQTASEQPTDESADAMHLDIGHWRDEAAERLAHVRAWVIANPLPALGIAVTAGFLAGRMVRR